MQRNFPNNYFKTIWYRRRNSKGRSGYTFWLILQYCFFFFLGGGRGARDFENARVRALMRVMFYVVCTVRVQRAQRAQRKMRARIYARYICFTLCVQCARAFMRAMFYVVCAVRAQKKMRARIYARYIQCSVRRLEASRDVSPNIVCCMCSARAQKKMRARARKIYKVKYKVFYGRARMGGGAGRGPPCAAKNKTIILQTTFATFSHWKLKVVQIWSAHQSKALIFYFGIKKILSRIFENFVENRQTKFHILKFTVCVNTHWIWTREMYFVCFPQNFHKSDSKFFYVKKKKSELSIDGLIISVPLLTSGVRKQGTVQIPNFMSQNNWNVFLCLFFAWA